MRTGVRFLVIMALLLAASAAGSAPASYTVSEIGTFGGPASCPSDINNLGQVVGYAETPSTWAPGFYCTRAFLWQNGVTTDLGSFGQVNGYAAAVNDAGAVVATSARNATPAGSFLWQGGVSTPLEGLDSAQGLNSLGSVVGTVYPDSSHSYAAVWKDGSVTNLGAMGGTKSTSRAINDSGWVVGWTTDANRYNHAFRWDGSSMLDLGNLGGTDSWAYDANNRGQIVGYSMINNYQAHGFVWQDGVMTDIGNFRPYAINDLGQMVGYYYKEDTGGWYAALWDSGVITNLSTLIRSTTPYVLENPTVDRYGINNAGQIVLTGKVYGSSSGYHALVLTPIPEPPSLATLALGLTPLTISLLRRKRQSRRRS